MHELMRAHSLATLVTMGADGLNANHIPFYIDTATSPYCALKGHVARSNPLLTGLVREVDVLAIFQGPQTYISPSWYATKADTGKVVPTWNYAVVHAYGKLMVHDDPKWIRQQMELLTQEKESAFQAPWAVSDAPEDFVEQRIRAVVGIEITVTKLQGKWKVSQNQPGKNQQSVIEALESGQSETGRSMAGLVKTRGCLGS